MTSEEVADVARLGSDINSLVGGDSDKRGVERREKPKWLFLNGDRRILRSITKNY